VKSRQIRFAATAHEHVLREKSWWMANRDHGDVFAEELEQALKIVGLPPGAGSPYARSPIPGVRRVYLRRIDAHLYYTFNSDNIIIRALWGARRKFGPELT
jgi:hypothetical protein